jgi:dipeptidyl aminopeptidase/acylaminoacyl peptidase
LWLESRPEDDGRFALMASAIDPSGEPFRLTPSGFGVGSRVYGHGGGDVVPLPDGAILVIAEHDQQWWRLPAGGGEPARLSAPEEGTLYADGCVTPNGRWLFCVREQSVDPEPTHNIVRIDLHDGSVAPLVTGHDFVAAPRMSSDGRRLAWLSWEHPHMPWDCTTLWVAGFDEHGHLVQPTKLAGGADRAVLQPQWLGPQTLGYLDDASGWWNPVHATLPAGDPARIMLPGQECAEPPWSLGCVGYGLLGGELLCVATAHARSSLMITSQPEGRTRQLKLPFTYYSRSSVAIQGDSVLAVASGPREPAAVVRIDLIRQAGQALAMPQITRLRADTDTAPDPAFRPEPRILDVVVEDGRRIDVIYFPPAHPGHRGMPGELPPLVLDIHGGPTSRVPLAYQTETVFWTSRGFAVAYPNYAGSSGAGRQQRERLRSMWGRVDVADCAEAIAAVCRQGWADAQRIVCRGASAGAYTALRLAEQTAWPRAVSSWYGVTDPRALIGQTHKFESRYVGQLLGSDAAPAVTSPRCPVLLLHGGQDVVVPAAQADTLRHRLARLDRLAIVEFPDERHGFEHPDAIGHAMAVELAFFREVLGLRAAEDVEAVPWLLPG